MNGNNRKAQKNINIKLKIYIIYPGCYVTNSVSCCQAIVRCGKCYCLIRYG